MKPRDYLLCKTVGELADRFSKISSAKGELVTKQAYIAAMAVLSCPGDGYIEAIGYKRSPSMQAGSEGCDFPKNGYAGCLECWGFKHRPEVKPETFPISEDLSFDGAITTSEIKDIIGVRDIGGDDDLTAKNLEKFDAVVAELRTTYEKKNRDYNDSFRRSLDKHGLISFVTRAEDKFERIDSLRKRPAHVTGESMKDTVKDLANYSIMAAMWMEDK